MGKDDTWVAINVDQPKTRKKRMAAMKIDDREVEHRRRPEAGDGHDLGQMEMW